MKIENRKVNFRRANADDVEILVDYRVRCLNEIYNHAEDDETQIIRKELREYFSGAIPSNDFIAWLAEYNGTVIATSGMVIWQIPARYGGLESGKLGYILNLYSVPEVRRRGICTLLLTELIKEAKSLGLRYLHLHASEEGINIYRKKGFVEPSQKELELILE